MKTVYQVLDLFYSTFGITPPKPGQERRSLVILLAIVVGCAVFVGGMLVILFLLR
jgi:hypothetical protein